MIQQRSLFPHHDLSSLVADGISPIQFPKIEGMFADEWENMDPVLKEMYDYEEDSRTYYLPEYEWLNWRNHGPYYQHPDHPLYTDIALGGSDVSALLDGSQMLAKYHFYDGQHGSPYKCASELYSEKSGYEFKMQEIRDQDVLWIGHNEEPAIRKLFKKIYEKDHPQDIVEIIQDYHMYRSSMYEFMQCDLDARIKINGMEGVLECKTCQYGSEDFKLWKQGICPLKYYAQVQWYLSIMNLPYAYIICKWGIRLTDCVYIYIERDLEFEKDLISLASDFVKCVRDGHEPNQKKQNINRLFVYWRKKSGPIEPAAPIVHLNSDLAPTICRIRDINEEVALLKIQEDILLQERKKLLVEDVFPVFGNSTKGSSFDPETGDHLEIRLKNKKLDSFLDEDRLRSELPNLYNQYCYQERVFNKTLFLKEQRTTAMKYMDSDKRLTDGKMDYCEVYAV